MDALFGGWEALVLLLSQFRAFKVPILGVYLFELTNTLLGAQLLRQQLNYRVHWLRAFVLTLVAGVGGNSAASFFTGKTPRWINGKKNLVVLCRSRWRILPPIRPRVVLRHCDRLLGRLPLPGRCHQSSLHTPVSAPSLGLDSRHHIRDFYR